MRTISLLVLGVILTLTLLAPAPAEAQSSALVGSYELMWRDLKGGSKLHAPKGVAGMMTYSDTRRNFNITWKHEDGSTASISYIGSYKLTQDEYCETPIYWMQNNMDGLGVVKYGPPPEKAGCSAVMRDGDTILFSLKGEAVIAMFEGNRVIATSADENGEVVFVDHWRRVD